MGRRVMDKTEADPKGLIRESYAIEGITIEECRSIFIDWVLSLGPQSDTNEALRALLVHYGEANPPGHPMTSVLTAALAPSDPPKRRGGRAARFAPDPSNP